jgi:hypothetical protein
MASRRSVAARRGRGREAGEGALEEKGKREVEVEVDSKGRHSGEEAVEREDVRTDGTEIVSMISLSTST